MKKTNYDISLSIHSIALGIVLGLIITAFITGIAVFISNKEYNNRLFYTINSLMSSYLAIPPVNQSKSDESSVFVYPAIETIALYDTTQWQTYYSEEMGVTFRYPQDWSVKLSEAENCVSSEKFGCTFLVIKPLAEDNTFSLIFTGSEEMKKQLDQTTFPVVIRFAGMEKIIDLYRQDKCIISLNGTTECSPDPEGRIQFAQTSFVSQDFNLNLYIIGNPSLEAAVILDSVKY